MFQIVISAAIKNRASKVGWMTMYRFCAINRKTKLTIMYAYNSVDIVAQKRWVIYFERSIYF